MNKLLLKLLATLGFVATMSLMPLVAPAIAADAPKNTTAPIVCVMGTFSPMPPDANTAQGIKVHWNDMPLTNLNPPPALASIVASCVARRGFTAKKDEYVHGIPFPRDPGPLRRHVVVVACSKLGSLAYDQVITPSRDFFAKLQPISSGSALEKQYCR